MVYNNKIEAIKAIRSIGFNAKLVFNSTTETYTLENSNLCLKDAKDMVEAIMELGVTAFLENHYPGVGPTNEELGAAMRRTMLDKRNIRF